MSLLLVSAISSASRRESGRWSVMSTPTRPDLRQRALRRAVVRRDLRHAGRISVCGAGVGDALASRARARRRWRDCLAGRLSLRLQPAASSQAQCRRPQTANCRSWGLKSCGAALRRLRLVAGAGVVAARLLVGLRGRLHALLCLPGRRDGPRVRAGRGRWRLRVVAARRDRSLRSTAAWSASACCRSARAARARVSPRRAAAPSRRTSSLPRRTEARGR